MHQSWFQAAWPPRCPLFCFKKYIDWDDEHELEREKYIAVVAAANDAAGGVEALETLEELVMIVMTIS
jgi:hypothetical protein